MTTVQKRNFYSLMYKIFVKKDKSILGENEKKSSQEVSEEDKDV